MNKLFNSIMALFMASVVVAQPLPDDLFISGTVVDVNGNTVAGAEVCAWSDSTSGFTFYDCATTDSQGYYYINITNGSTSGPNVDFTVAPSEFCPNLPWQGVVISNQQGSVDVATADFVSCSGGGGNCDVTISVVPDSTSTNLFYLTANATGAAPFTYSWDNGSTTQTAPYINNGIILWNGCVTVTDSSGCVATACDNSWWNNIANCFADFTLSSPNGIIAGDTVSAQFTGSQSFGNSYFWNITAAGMSIMTSTEMNPMFVVPPTLVPIGGINVDICVTVTDSLNNCSDTYCQTVYVSDGNIGNCTASITSTIDTSGGGLVYVLTAEASGNPPFAYVWSTGEIGGSIIYQPNPLFGDTVCVTITDVDGCVATSCTIVGGNTGSCNADFYYYNDSLCMQPLECFQFVDASSGLNTQPVSWFWDFGNNNISTEQNPVFAYGGPGTYTVCLTTTMSDGCSDTYCTTLIVGGGSGNCDASFTYGVNPASQDWMFAANSQDPNLTYTWTMGGAVVSTDMSFDLGLTTGTYNMCLTVTNVLDTNCYDMQCETFTVGGGNCEGYLTGNVYAGSPNFPLDEGMVYLITFDPLTNLLTAVDSTQLDSGNFYFFGPVPCGDYLLKAAATSGSQYYSNHIPTYFGNSPFWDFAETISITSPNTFITADVTLIAGANPGGPGFIGGDVTQGANKVGDIGDPVIGVTVLLFDNASNVISYQYTDANGEFGFDNLPWGTYQVYVEMLNKTTIPVVVTIGPDEPSFNGIHVLVFDTEITTDVDEQEIVTIDTGLYPNPTTNTATVQISSEIPVALQVEVKDLTGRMILNSVSELNSGANTITLDVSSLSEGYYNVVFRNLEKGVSLSQKLIVVD